MRASSSRDLASTWYYTIITNEYPYVYTSHEAGPPLSLKLSVVWARTSGVDSTNLSYNVTNEPRNSCQGPTPLQYYEYMKAAFSAHSPNKRLILSPLCVLRMLSASIGETSKMVSLSFRFSV